MKSKTKVLFIFLLIGLVFANPAMADLVNCGGPGDAPEGCRISDLIFTIERIINFLLSWAWLISLFFIMWAAYNMITAGGNQEALSTAKATFKNAILGFFLIMASYLLINFIVGLLHGDLGLNAGEFDIVRNLLPRP